MKHTYNWVAEWRFEKGMFLHICEGDAENGMEEPFVFVSKKPTYFRTKEACRKWTRGWLRGSFKIYKVENK